jgi:hypothetical protein
MLNLLKVGLPLFFDLLLELLIFFQQSIDVFVISLQE